MDSEGTLETEPNLLDEGSLNYDQLLAFLVEVSDSFPVPLADKVNLSEYAEKLLRFGTMSAATDGDGRILSLCAGYTTNTPNRYAYISAVAVQPDQVGKGLASRVVKEFEKRAEEAGLLGIHLYADFGNSPAMTMWSHFGYKIERFVNESRPNDAHFLKLIRRTVLVTALGSMSCSTTIRSLRKAGYRIVGCDVYDRKIIANSQFVDRFYTVPFAKDASSYLAAIAEIAEIERVGFIIPSTDDEVDALCNVDTVKGAIVCLSRRDALVLARNKLKAFNAVASIIGPAAIPTLKAPERSPGDEAFPLICKPLHGRSSQGLFCAYSTADYEYFFKRSNVDDYCVQPLIKGQVVTVDVVRQDDAKVILLPRRELLRTRNGAGISVEVFAPPEKLIDLCIKLANALGVTGCVNFEFIEDSKGSYRFLECNPRFSGGLGFSLEAGYDCAINHLRCFQGLLIEDLESFSPGFIARRYEEYRIDGSKS